MHRGVYEFYKPSVAPSLRSGATASGLRVYKFVDSLVHAYNYYIAIYTFLLPIYIAS